MNEDQQKRTVMVDDEWLATTSLAGVFAAAIFCAPEHRRTLEVAFFRGAKAVLQRVDSIIATTEDPMRVAAALHEMRREVAAVLDRVQEANFQ